MNSVWQNAWDSALPRLTALGNTVVSGNTPDARITRVGKLDSELLDQQLVSLLQEPLNKALGTISTSLRARFELELCLLIQLTLYKLSVWNTGASYGAKIQDLRYRAPHIPGPKSPSGLPRNVLLVHGAITVLVPYLHARLRTHALSNAWPDAPSSDRRRKAWLLLSTVESTHSLAGLIGFVAFLWDGRYRTIADRMLGMKLVPARKQVRRDVSYEFMNRQMVWHAFTEFLLFLLPLLNARAVRRQLTRLSTRILTSLTPKQEKPSNSQLAKIKRGPHWSLPLDQCAICAENASFSLNLTDSSNVLTAALAGTSIPTTSDPLEQTPESESEPPDFPLHTPYVASCGDVYCYHCVAERMLQAAEEGEEDMWECIRCCEPVRSCERMLGSVLDGSESEMTDFGEDDDGFGSSVSDLGRSSYSGSSN